jgi:triosephosphate isomerase
MRPSLVAANWKMNGSRDFLRDYVERLELDQPLGVDVVLCPPSIYLADLVQAVSGMGIACGAQDVGIQPSGAHTGEIAAEMIAEVGAEWVIVGHSERRMDQDEKDDLVATKAAAALRAGLRPIVCVGETLAERKAGHEIVVVERQLEAVVDRIDLAGFATGAIAYEPIWAIGTGETATAQQAQEMHAFIRDKIAHLDQAIAQQIRVVYGGSVKPDNAQELFGQTDIDGGLVGGAGLDPEQFAQIVHAATKIGG